jgi:hypothetical protein
VETQDTQRGTTKPIRNTLRDTAHSQTVGCKLETEIKMNNSAIDINDSTIKKYVELLRPKDPEIRKQIDFGYSYDGKIAIIYEIRPV